MILMKKKTHHSPNICDFILKKINLVAQNLSK